jgi:hypothetical protein
LATATNLTEGRLEVIGESPDAEDQPGAYLDQALLASSAFPAVFRPRWSWELRAGAPRAMQYVDGGVMDNLPMDAIARFLDRAARVGRRASRSIIKPDPRTPHLIVGASLEVNAPNYELEFTRRRLRRSWLALQRRAKQLRYNTKLDAYEFAEHALRAIRDHAANCLLPRATRAEQLVSIELVPIKPNWLCGTFAFHPMLGFRRINQARSIAHGCATTLLKFAAMHGDRGSQPLEDWGIQQNALPKHERWSTLFTRSGPPERDGKCWLRDCACPFSRKSLSDPRLGLESTVIDEVSKIHSVCPRPETHLRKI